jgi:prenyltransferase beta subunit
LKYKLRSLTFLALIITLLLGIAPIASAKTRQLHLIDFLYENHNGNESFGTSSQDTANAIEIIDFYGAYKIEGFLQAIKEVDIPTLEVYLEDEITSMFNEEVIDIYDLFYLLSTLDSLGTQLDSNLHDKIYVYINETVQSTGGFSPTNTSTSANLISTFYMYNIFTLIDEPVENQTLHKNWVLSCNNTDGGYGGNQSLSSTLLTTYYAIYLVKELGEISDLTNQTSTLNYLKSFYVNDHDNLENYGGYLPDVFAQNSLLSSTYFCVEGIRIINSNELNKEATVNWVLNHQNFQDGGFSDHSEENDQRLSSISASYYTFEILKGFNSLDLLNEDIFMVEFNFFMLIIVTSISGIIIAAIYLIWRKRRI